MRKRLLLFHPASEGPYLPLSLLAIARQPAARGCAIDIVDATIQRDYAERIAQLAPGALCLGVSVLTGGSILGAIEATRIARSANPALPVIWGGWHASIMPEQCLEHADVAVMGQGEETFAELVELLASSAEVSRCAGICFTSGGEPKRTAPRPFADINRFSPMDYGLLDVEAYFRAKGTRQIEYLSSFGCSFNCTFCADPLVVKRRWTGLRPERVVGDLAELQRRHGVDDVIFADDHFFNNPERVARICKGLMTLPRKLRWFATARADVFAKHQAQFIDLLAPAGCRTLFFGIESGDEPLRRRLGKGVTRADLLRCARQCEERGIETNFTYIVGLPGETETELQATLREASLLRRACEHASTKMFFYSPYPGTELFAEAARRGLVHSKDLIEWGRFGDHDAQKPWLSPAYRRRIETASFYHAHMNERGQSGLTPTASRRVLRALSRLRGSLSYYGLPWELALSRARRRRRERGTTAPAFALKEAV